MQPRFLHTLLHKRGTYNCRLITSMWSADENAFILFWSCLSTAMVSKYVSLSHMLLLWCVCNVWGKETKPVCLKLLFFPVCKRPAALLLLFSSSFFLSQPCAVIACCQQHSRSLPALQREFSQKRQKGFWRVNGSGCLLRPLDCGWLKMYSLANSSQNSMIITEITGLMRAAWLL